MLATAVAAALLLAAGDASAQTKGAATKAEVQSIQAQMQALADRLNKLEAANATLQSENADLKAIVESRDAETEYLKAQTKDLREDGAVAANEISKVKGADWATKIKLRGDLRYRSREHLARACRGRQCRGCGRPISPTHSCTARLRRDGDRQREGDVAARHRRG